MNVSDVQRHLDNLVKLLDDGGAKVAKDLSCFRSFLNPFANMTLKEFAGLLEMMDAFRRDGRLDEKPKRGQGKSSSTISGKQEPPKVDPISIAIETKAFYERVSDPSVTAADIDELIVRISQLKTESLRPVAEAVGVQVGKKIVTKNTLADIERHIRERKGATQRAEHLHSPPPGGNGPSRYSDEPMGANSQDV